MDGKISEQQFIEFVDTNYSTVEEMWETKVSSCRGVWAYFFVCVSLKSGVCVCVCVCVCDRGSVGENKKLFWKWHTKIIVSISNSGLSIKYGFWVIKTMMAFWMMKNSVSPFTSVIWRCVAMKSLMLFQRISPHRSWKGLHQMDSAFQFSAPLGRIKSSYFFCRLPME